MDSTTESGHDRLAEIFSEALFTYLWYTENLISGTTASETVGEMTDFITDAAKAVVILSAVTVPEFIQSMENFFKRNAMTRANVFTFLAIYCFASHKIISDNIFEVLLNNCSFVYRLVIYCQHKGHVEYIEFASMCWSEIFEVDIKDEFYEAGGWDEFKMYVAQNRYIPKDPKPPERVFVNFLEEINYLFPKLAVSETEEYSNIFSPAAALAELEATATLELLESRLASGCINVCDPPADEANSYTNANPNTSETPELSDDDSDEELFQELVRASLHSISKVDASPPMLGCLPCQNENGLRTTKPNQLVMCPKHHPDSFYYMVTKPEAVELCDDN